jgi:hypothetical protein
MERIAEASPRFKARMAGVSQRLEALTATFGQVIVLGRLVVSASDEACRIEFASTCNPTSFRLRQGNDLLLRPIIIRMQFQHLAVVG